jgi:hypothetical protein
MDTELNPCPFCKSIPTLREQDGVWSVWCTNGDCPATSVLVEGYSREETVPAWNQCGSGVIAERNRIESEVLTTYQSKGFILPYVVLIKIIRNEWSNEPQAATVENGDSHKPFS